MDDGHDGTGRSSGRSTGRSPSSAHARTVVERSPGSGVVCPAFSHRRHRPPTGRPCRGAGPMGSGGGTCSRSRRQRLLRPVDRRQQMTVVVISREDAGSRGTIAGDSTLNA